MLRRVVEVHGYYTVRSRTWRPLAAGSWLWIMGIKDAETFAWGYVVCWNDLDGACQHPVRQLLPAFTAGC